MSTRRLYPRRSRTLSTTRWSPGRDSFETKRELPSNLARPTMIKNQINAIRGTRSRVKTPAISNIGEDY